MDIENIDCSIGNARTNQEWKEDKKMSFVGMALCEDGIVAFGDSKGSITDVFGNLKYDKKRGLIKKVFKNEDYVLVTCNCNSFLGVRGEICYIENLLNKYIKNDYHSLLDNLLCTLCVNQSNFNNLYKFMIGAKDELGYYIQYIDIQQGSIILYKKIRIPNIYTMGNSYYTDLTKELHFEPLLVSKGKEKLPQLLEHLIKKANEVSSYNPVGLPVNIEIFQQDSFME